MTETAFTEVPEPPGSFVDVRSRGSAVAAVAELQWLRARVIEARLIADQVTTDRLTAATQITMEVARTSNLFRAIVHYWTTAVEPTEAGESDSSTNADAEVDADQAAGPEVWHAHVAFDVCWAHPEDQEFAQEEIEAYCATYGVIAVHPYARAQLSSLTSSLAVPVLVLDTLHIPG